MLVAPRVFWVPPVVSGRAARCARGRRPAREPSAPRASLGALARCLARPRRRPRALQLGPPVPPPPTGTAAWPSGPSGALHTCGARCADGWFGALARCLASPRRRPRALQLGPPVPPAPFIPVGPGVLMGGLVRWLVVWPVPAAAHGHCSLALRSLRRPSYLWGLVAVRWLGALARCPASPRRRPRAPQLGPPAPPVWRWRVFGIGSSVLDRNGASG